MDVYCRYQVFALQLKGTNLPYKKDLLEAECKIPSCQHTIVSLNDVVSS